MHLSTAAAVPGHSSHSPGRFSKAMLSSNDFAPNSALSPTSPRSLRGVNAALAELTGSFDSSVAQSNSLRTSGPSSPPMQTIPGASPTFSHSSSRHLAVSPQRRIALASPSTPASLDTFSVVQLLERELAAERAERRDEVSFITKTYEKEVDVWRGRTRCASQRLEEERKVFEQENGALDSKLAVVLERTRWYEERVQRLEEEVAKRDKSLDETNEIVRRIEATAADAVRDREVERHRDRELTRQEYDKMSLQLQRTEHDAREAARNATKEELVVQKRLETMGQALKNAEATNHELKQQETRALAEMCSQETQALARARQQAESEVAVMRTEVVRYESMHNEAVNTHAQTRQQAEAAIRDVELERNAERAKLEDRVAELRTLQAQLVERGAATLDATRVEHQAQVAKLQARITELVEEKLHAQSVVEHVKIMHQNTEQSLELQICEAGKRFDEMRDDRKEFDFQRDQTLQQESEAAMLRRLEVTWLRTELEDLKIRTAQDLDDVRAQRSRESEYHEGREIIAAESQKNHLMQVRELEAKLSEAEIHHVRLKASLSSVEKEEARSNSALDFLRPELAACEAIAQKERDSKECEYAALVKLRSDLLDKVQEVEKQKLQLQSELEEGEVARLHALHEQARLESETQNLLRLYRLEEQRVAELDGSMRQHLQLIDHEVSDLCSLRALLASVDGFADQAPTSESVDTFLNSLTLPASPQFFK